MWDAGVMNELGLYTDRATCGRLQYLFCRLTPTYMLVLAVCVTVFPHLGEGPMWLGEQEGELVNCHHAWWSNLFYVNNFFYVKSREMCMGWTWYLADDMQFYVFAPVLLVLLLLYHPFLSIISGTFPLSFVMNPSGTL